MTAYNDQNINTFSPISAATQVTVTQATQAVALPSTSGASNPCLVIVAYQGNMNALYVKFGTSGAVTVSMTDGMKVPPGDTNKPTILSVPIGSTHIAILCDGQEGIVAITGADGKITSFAPNGASVDITVTETSQAVAIPTTGSGGSPSVNLVGLQSGQVAWWIRFGSSNAVTVARDTGQKVYPGGAVNPTILSVPSGSTHFAILCEGPTGIVRVTGGVLTAPPPANGTITNAMLANMAQATIKGRAAGAGTGSPQDLTGTQATAILDTFTSGLKGLVPASGGGTGTYLRADGTFAVAGVILQVLRNANSANTTINGGTAANQIPLDDSTPTSSEGVEILSQAITVGAATNQVLCTVSLLGSINASSEWSASLFRGTTCIQAQTTWVSSANRIVAFSFNFLDTPGSAATHTYSVRAGPPGNQIVAINGNALGRVFGGISTCSLTVQEVAA